MKFTCSQQKLSKALNIVSKAVSTRTTILVSNPETLFTTRPIPDTPPAAISHGKKKYSSAIAVNATPIVVNKYSLIFCIHISHPYLIFIYSHKSFTHNLMNFSNCDKSIFINFPNFVF